MRFDSGEVAQPCELIPWSREADAVFKIRRMDTCWDSLQGPLLSEESLRQVLAEQLSAASQQILQQQAALLEQLREQPQVRYGDRL